MCGIAGVFDMRGRPDMDAGLISRMNGVQRHRGPDDEGVHIEPGLMLGHRRLSIIDLSGGHQPLFNDDHSVGVVFNGEIYNFQELVEELEPLGYRFRTRSDTEVIVHAWDAWGEQCVHRFRGMFAFALWDKRTETLFLARDRFGVKPLFYAAMPNGQVAFASELKAVLLHPGFRRELDPSAVEQYFALGYVAEPQTIYSQVQKLPPGAVLTLRRGDELRSPRVYWDITFTNDSPITFEEAVEELHVRLRESVRLRMISDVPLGAFLSGGVDSSAVVACMAGFSSQPVNTCSIAFDDPAYNESEYAEKVARQYQTDHFVRTVASNDFDLIDTLAQLYDEPYADSSAIPTYRVCQLARERVTVALSGDGGDEIFGGYRRYRLHLAEERLRALLPLAMRRPLFGPLGHWFPKLDWAPRVFRGKTTFESLARDSVEAYFHSMSLLREPLRSGLYSDAMRRTLDGYSAFEVFRRHAGKVDSDDALSLIQYIDMKTYLVGDINTKVDRASMAHSLEVREPLMDHPLAEWMASLPSRLRMRRGQGKYLLKKAHEDRLPHDVLYRPKMGFAVPLDRWFRGPLAERVRKAMHGDLLNDTGFFERRQLQHLVDAHQSGARDYSAPLWSLLMFEAFLRNGEGLTQQSEPMRSASL